MPANEPVGGEKKRCNANIGHMQCRATKNLTGVQVNPLQWAHAALLLPATLSISLCPKHFAFKTISEAPIDPK